MSARRGLKRKRPFLVGLTGSFGTGKTTVAAMFQRKGAKVLSADRLAHEVFKKGNPLYSKIRRIFPEVPGRLSRAKIAPFVFGSPKRRRRLEALVHPYIFKRLREKMKRTKSRVVIAEVPLLFESGFHRLCDRTIVVYAPQRMIFKRLRPYTRAEIRSRWRAQMHFREKARRADYVIDNSNGFKKTRNQVDRIWKEWN